MKENLIEDEEEDMIKEDLFSHLPQKEKLKLFGEEEEEIKKNEKINEEERKLLEINKQYIESKLWCWEKEKEFEFKLPSTIFTKPINVSNKSELRYENELLQYENPDIIGQHFSEEILNQIWQNGEFNINSTNPELPYTWKLAYFTVKGIKNVKLRYQKDMSISFLFLYSLYYRFSTYNYNNLFPCSFPSSAYHLYKFFYNTINLFFGLPLYRYNEFEITKKIKHQRLLNFLENNSNMDLLFFVAKNKEKLKKLDLLFNTKWIKEIEPNLRKKYKEQNLSTENMNSNLVEDKKREYLNFLEENIEFNKFQELHPSTKDYLSSQQIINDAEFFYRLEREQKIENFKNELKNHYIKDLCELWHRDKMNEYYSKVDKETNLEKERKIKREIQNKREPYLVYNYNTDNEREIPTLVEKQLKESKEPLETFEIRRNLTKPYKKCQREENNGEVRYYLKKYEYYKVKTSFLFWRVVLFLTKYFCSFFNFNLFICRQMTDSMFGIKALFTYTLFREYSIDSRTGGVFEIDETITFPRSAHNLWTWIIESRANFESTPDTGILGKSCTRIFHLFLNYIIRLLILGSLLITLYPTLIILNTVICFCLIICSPVLTLLWIILDYLFCIIIYNRFDELKLFPLIRIVILDFFVGFVIQLICSLLSIIVQPILSIFFFFYSQIHFLLRFIYDAIFYFIFKCFGRVPITNSCISWLVAGPGLFRDRYYDMKNKDILTLVIADLEKRVMSNYEQKIKQILDEPRNSIQEIQKIYQKVCLNFGSNTKINQSIDFYKEKLREQIKKRNVYPKCNVHVKFTEERLEEVKNMVELYVTEYSVINDISFALNKYEEKKIEGLSHDILQSIFGYQIFEPLQETDKIVKLKSVFKNELDNIATKIFENPQFDDRIYIEERPKEQKAISFPDFAYLGQIFDGDLNINLSLLKKEDKDLLPILVNIFP